MKKIHSVKELPENSQPYEKCLKCGAQSLTDAELLAVLLRTGTSDFNAIDVSQMVLNKGRNGLLNLYLLGIRDLQKIPGIGKVKAVQLKCIAEIARRITKTSKAAQVTLKSAASVAQFYMEDLRHAQQEQLIVCMFDTGCNLIHDEVISIGTVNASLVSPREVFLKALEYKAVYIILLHNHPSGNTTPSQADYHTTKAVSECGKLLDIILADHIIIGDNEYFSFRENGILNENGSI